MNKIFKIADIKILVDTDFDFIVTERFYDFIYSDNDYDVKYEFIKSRECIHFKSKPIYENLEYKIYEENDKIYRVFYECDNQEPYACLVISNGIKHNYRCYLYPSYTKHRLSIINLFDIMALEYIMIKQDTIILHSSYICYNNRAILFSAPSNTGKSTQADLWNKYKNARIINGDRTFINKRDDKWIAHGSPYSGSSNIFKNESYNLGNIILLKQGELNKAYTPTFREIYSFLIKEITINYWDIDFYNKAIDILLDLINNIDVYTLECLPNKEAVELLEKVLGGTNK